MLLMCFCVWKRPSFCMLPALDVQRVIGLTKDKVTAGHLLLNLFNYDAVYSNDCEQMINKHD